MTNESTENDFKKYLGWNYSPQGHNYQLSYAAQAAKKSPGTIIIQTKDQWYVLRIKTEKHNIDNSTSEFYFSPGICTYYFGHKVGINDFIRYLNAAILNRSYIYYSSFDSAPGFSKYIVKQIKDYYYQFLKQNRIPEGFTVACMIQKNSVDKGQTHLIYPNNTKKSSLFLWEGDLSSEDIQTVKEAFKKNQIDIEDFSEEELLKLKNTLIHYDFLRVDFKKKEAVLL